MNFAHPSWRTHPLRTGWRVAASLVRRRVPWLRRVVVPYDTGRSSIEADLGTALGLLLYRYGYADPDVDLLRALLTPGDVFVDGGAALGSPRPGFSRAGPARRTGRRPPAWPSR